MPKAACRASTPVVKPQGEARPAWKVLRVLANLLGLQGFSFESTADVLATVGDNGAVPADALSNATCRRCRGRQRRARRPWSRASTSSTRSCAARRRCSSPPMRAMPRTAAASVQAEEALA